MKPDSNSKRCRRQRRFILTAGLLALCYPFLKFVTFKVPRKRRRIEVNTAIAAGDYFVHQEFILFAGESGYRAVSRKCTHLGCKVNFHEVGGYMECPCHQSKFGTDGRVLQGPAKRDLPIYDVETRDSAPYFIVTV